jgi:hypothetical protein
MRYGFKLRFIDFAAMGFDSGGDVAALWACRAHWPSSCKHGRQVRNPIYRFKRALVHARSGAHGELAR